MVGLPSRFRKQRTSTRQGHGLIVMTYILHAETQSVPYAKSRSSTFPSLARAAGSAPVHAAFTHLSVVQGATAQRGPAWYRAAPLVTDRMTWRIDARAS